MKRALALVLAAALFSSTIAVQQRIDAVKALVEDEVLYLPNERLLTHFTAGLNNVIADLIWLQCVQYTGKQIKGGGDFQWLQHMLDTATRLDPNFVDVYLYGGILLSELRHDDDAGIRLLERGYQENPTAWELPHEIAMTYLIKRRELPGAYALGAYYMGVAASTGKAPERILVLAESLKRDTDLDALEVELWTRLAREATENGNDLMRGIAERKLALIQLRAVLKTLNGRVDAYEQQTGRRPRNADELMRLGLLTPEVIDPLGGTFFLDPQGRVQNTSVLNDVMEQRLRVLQNALRSYHEQNGRYPERLELLLSEGGLLEWQPHPYPGRAWVYEPVTGALSG